MAARRHQAAQLHVFVILTLSIGKNSPRQLFLLKCSLPLHQVRIILYSDFISVQAVKIVSWCRRDCRRDPREVWERRWWERACRAQSWGTLWRLTLPRPGFGQWSALVSPLWALWIYLLDAVIVQRWHGRQSGRRPRTPVGGSDTVTAHRGPRALSSTGHLR